jgi:hypothetical protein
MDNYLNHIQRVLSLRDINMDDYLTHTKVFLEYDNEEAFIFLTRNLILFTYITITRKIKERIMYEITFDKVIIYNLALFLFAR